MVTLAQLAEWVGGRVVGDDQLRIVALAPLDQAGPGTITFLANPKYLPALRTTRASAVIIDKPLERADLAYLVCDNPYLAFAKVLTRLHVRPPAPLGVLPGVSLAPTAELGEQVTVHSGAVIGERVRLGDGCLIHPNVVLYADVQIGPGCVLHAGVVIREGCRLGARVIVGPNAVIGNDGFGFAPEDGGYYKIPQVGIVEIGDDVEIGACACIDRATFGVTRIGRGCKIDNLVQIGHNVTVGEDTVMAAQAGVAGSTRVGRHCTFGGQSGTAGHIRIGDNLTLAGRGGIVGNIAGDQVVSGVPAIPHRDWLKASAAFAQLPQMRRELADLRRQLATLQQGLTASDK
ncbi:UDP-3-O-(3-hydroxymyristoyl)glucosamine N-acyltransferase [Desulfuromonas thiophila]|uniref:UDP-3-O-(3-hydroxymyristoyl)glucosamine N-acyltransferase n=1 Tax=Desulfuromonas thiophila TaxID=57664 RepID=UPI0024A8A851|nr:UDP-3-O-(3-hydroxymyristoyl)glucosamine N-acyltransferase [Desulfuromonas thiophila]